MTKYEAIIVLRNERDNAGEDGIRHACALAIQALHLSIAMDDEQAQGEYHVCECGNGHYNPKDIKDS